MIEPLADRRFLLEMSGEVVSFPLANILAIQGETYNNVSIDTSMVSFDAIDYYFQVVEEDVIAFQIGIGDIFTKTTEALTRTFKVTNKLVDGYGWVKLIAVLVTSESLIETPVEIIPNGITVVQGLKGDTGTKGDKGDIGLTGASAYEIAVANGFVGTEQEWLASLAASSSYLHTQSSPATVWNINHNLNRYPSIELYSVGLVKFEADIQHINLNQAVVYLTTTLAGLAQCN